MMDIPDNLFPFRDRQQDPVYGFCPVCGDEIYNPDDDVCLDCVRRMKLDAEWEELEDD